MEKPYHLFCEGDYVLFRDDADYIFFNNRLAIAGLYARLTILAETIMSSHFHVIVETSNETALLNFMQTLKQGYSYHYSRKYGTNISKSFNMQFVAIDSVEMTKKELLYVMKNAVHHYVSPFPLEYEYSSAPWMFIHNLVPAQITDAYLSTCTRAENLNYRQLKKYIGTATIPPDWQFSNKGMILPLSFVNLERARAFWSSNVKKFLYDINQSGTDARKEIISMDILDLRTSGYRDTEVCALIDAYCKDVSKQSCHNLDLKERQEIESILKRRRIPQNQIRRCLWWGSKL